MSWLTNLVRPKLRALVRKTEVPDKLWVKCPKCEQMIFHRELEANLNVCPRCDHHMRLSAPRRLELLFDDGRYEVVDGPRAIHDPLKFRDHRRYTDRLKDAESATGRSDAMLVGKGRVGGMPVVVAALDFEFMGGSMGIAVGDSLIAAARLAVRERTPLIVVSSSGGARMQEGILALMQLPRTVIAVQEVKEAGLPYITVLADPTTGGVSASFGMLGDVAIAEPGAVIGFAGPRVIEETIRQTLPAGFQRAEYLLEHGMVDMVARRAELRGALARVLSLLTKPSLPSAGRERGADGADSRPVLQLLRKT